MYSNSNANRSALKIWIISPVLNLNDLDSKMWWVIDYQLEKVGLTHLLPTCRLSRINQANTWLLINMLCPNFKCR